MAFLESVMLTKTLPCLADPGKCIVIGRPSRNLDGVLPLVAAVAPNVISFNPAAGTLTLRRQPGFITFYPEERGRRIGTTGYGEGFGQPVLGASGQDPTGDRRAPCTPTI
jgi:hypothetical protein